MPQTRTLLADYDRCAGVPPVDSNPCKRGWGSFHTGGMNAAMGDGSVRFIRQSIAINLWVSVATISGGEVAQLD